MKVRISGFLLTYHREIDLTKLVEELKQKQKTRITVQGYARVLTIAEDNNYVFGSLLTDRGHKNFVAIDTNDLSLSRGTLGKKKNFGAFNFFLLSKKKNAGIITSYREAGGASLVFGLIQKVGDEMLKNRLKSELGNLEHAGSEKEKKRLSNRYSLPSLKWTEVLGKEEYDAVLQKWKRIRAIELTFKVANTRGDFIPIPDDALEFCCTRLTFQRDTTVDRAIQTIRNLWRSDKREEAEKIKVEGLDEWGLSRRVQLNDQIPSFFGDLDHDEIVADNSSFVEPLNNSFVIKHLIEVARQYPAIFG